jgi:hypothetical protein
MANGSLNLVQMPRTYSDEKLWSRVAPWLVKLENEFDGEWPAQDVLEQNHSGTMTIFSAKDAEDNYYGVLGVIIKKFPNGITRAEIVFCVADNMDMWVGLFKELTEFVKSEFGADVIRFWGRDGFQKKLGEYGFKKSLACYTLEVSK